MGDIVPPRGWVTLSVREDVKRRLEELASKLGMTSLNDVISYLLDKYKEFTDISVRLEKLLTDISVRLTDISVKQDKLLTDMSVRLEKHLAANTNTLTSGGVSATSVSSNIESKQHVIKGSKKTAIEILREVKVRCIGDMRSAKNPEAIIEKMKVGGAVVVRTDEDVCAVDPEFWDLFKKKLNESKTPDDKEILSRLKDEKMKKLFQLLRKAGALYLDAKSKEWIYDYSFIEEPGGRRREEEEVSVDWEYA